MQKEKKQKQKESNKKKCKHEETNADRRKLLTDHKSHKKFQNEKSTKVKRKYRKKKKGLENKKILQGIECKTNQVDRKMAI